MSVYVSILLVLVLFGALIMLRHRRVSQRREVVTDGKDVQFSPEELAFLHVLEQAISDEYLIFSKVRLGDFIRRAKKKSWLLLSGERSQAFQKRLDFVICRASDLEILGVIELDDQFSILPEQETIDNQVAEALEKSNIPLVRFAVCNGYSVEDVRVTLVHCLALSSNPDVVQIDKALQAKAESGSGQIPVSHIVLENGEIIESLVEDLEPFEIVPLCPRCSSQMVKRKATQGASSGKYFWTCSMYPGCRHIAAQFRQ